MLLRLHIQNKQTTMNVIYNVQLLKFSYVRLDLIANLSLKHTILPFQKKLYSMFSSTHGDNLTTWLHVHYGPLGNFTMCKIGWFISVGLDNISILQLYPVTYCLSNTK